jgi:hypothetical protein
LWVLRSGLFGSMWVRCIWFASKSRLGGCPHEPKECCFECFAGFEVRAIWFHVSRVHLVREEIAPRRLSREPKECCFEGLVVLRQGRSDPIQAGCVWSAKKSGLGGLLHGPKECYFEGFVGFEARVVRFHVGRVHLDRVGIGFRRSST